MGRPSKLDERQWAEIWRSGLQKVEYIARLIKWHDPSFDVDEFIGRYEQRLLDESNRLAASTKQDA